MKKKLYKAKKKWVVSVVASFSFFAMGVSALADNTNQAETNTSFQDSTRYTLASSSNQASNSDDNTPYDNDFRSNGTYNPDAWLNKNAEIVATNPEAENIGSWIPTYNHQVNGGDPFITLGGKFKKITPKPVLITDTNNEQFFNQYKLKYQGDRYFTDYTGDVSSDAYRYLWNGTSYAIQFVPENTNPNYKPINYLSQYLSYKDSLFLQTLQKNGSIKFYDDGNLALTIDGPITPLQETEIEKLASENAPEVTFNKDKITSFIQSQLLGEDTAHWVSYDIGWRGYTYKDGQPLSISDVLEDRPILLHKLNSSEKINDGMTGLEALSDYLRFAMANSKNRNQYLMPVSQEAINDNKGESIPVIPISANEFIKGPLSFYFAEDGVYVLVSRNGVQYVATAVKVPMYMLKPEYRALFGKSSTTNNDVSSSNSSENQDTFDQQKEDIKAVDDATKEAIEDELPDLIPSDVIKEVTHKIQKDAGAFMYKTQIDHINSQNFANFAIDVSKDLTDTVLGISVDGNLIKDTAKDIGESLTTAISGATKALIDSTLNNPISLYLDEKKNSKERYEAFTKRRERYIDEYKARHDVLSGVGKGTKNAAKDVAKDTTKVSTKSILLGAAFSIAIAIVVAIKAVGDYDLLNLSSEANSLKIKIKNRWKL